MVFTRWDPWREFEALRREVARAFDHVGIELPTGPFSRPAFLPGTAARAYPLLNMSEDKDHVYVEALAPGLDTETLAVSVVRDTLRIAGQKQAISEDIKPDAYHRNERGAGAFDRSISLPVEVDGGKVTAEYRQGVLLITLPKAEAAKPKHITVKVN
jgi:HSP20 family protein